MAASGGMRMRSDEMTESGLDAQSTYSVVQKYAITKLSINRINHGKTYQLVNLV